ncbi:MBL fold metallo-hydrolase [Clostridium sp. AWRP]|uniref:MBL fold metallo-hydrolase n=1 Tax=Clostridium sp. AWRP TaxID=2212991 RepID=UPI000FDB9133|nr:MBL fold metallo-hydrolase [Clostridium sp. AWRP]AZV58472.1 MBL fold metallo-hydrolase [Clostridium sp. AWRP]
MNFKIVTLIENKPGVDPKLYSEHGLSLYIEVNGFKILFDTGQSGNFIKNAERLNVDLNNLNYVILSHGHYDHSGGFKKFVDKVKSPYKLIVGKEFFNRKYKFTEEKTYKYIGNSFNEEFVNKNNIPIKYVEEDIFYINKDIMIFSNFNKNNDFELTNPKFQIKQNRNYTLDDFSDEIVLVVKLDKGLMVIVGCSHVGIINILETIIEKTGMPIYGIVGGTHLLEANDLRLNSTIKFIKEKDIRVLEMCHCTGEKAIKEMKLQLKKRFLYNNTGNVII